ncbi:MAG: hypothetical protein BIFFINMI_01122 [Phycisphaerae bacterium]|nr:hypothetical protein [Phycisphaerae bacterium]
MSPVRPFAICVLLAATGLGGCVRHSGLSADSRSPEPRTDVQHLGFTVEPVASDTDKDGWADSVTVFCRLYVEQPKWEAVVGRGRFHFSVFPGRESARTRIPCAEYDIPFEQSLGCVQRDRYGLITYSFRLPLGNLPTGTREVVIEARFYPEGSRDSVEPCNQIVGVPAYSPA